LPRQPAQVLEHIRVGEVEDLLLDGIARSQQHRFRLRQPPAQETGVMNVSRPSGDNDWGRPSGRTPSSTSAVPPSGVATRSAWPVF
jgi:hypothetical protein